MWLCFGLPAIFAVANSELLEQRPDLAKYQDAWKGLLVPGKYYLYMRSYEYEPLYGLNKKCVSSELLSVNKEEMYTVNRFQTVDPKDGSTTNITAYAWAKTSEGYPTPNLIESSPSLEKDFTLTYAMAFLEYNNCEIQRPLHRKNGCELWVKDADKINSLCFFIFHLLCGPEKYMIYDKDLCHGK